jgi:TetR/AcrR family transcriptional repressor of nem operon
MKKKPDYENLLKVGILLFREQGFHNTGTEEILTKADYPRSSFYYHFKSKEGFGVKTLESYGDNVTEFLSGLLSDPEVKSPTERLKSYFVAVSKKVTEKDYGTICLVQRFSAEASENQGVLQEAAHAQLLKWVEVAKPCVKEAQEMGEIRNDLSTQQATEFLFNTIFGACTIGRLSRDPEELNSKVEFGFKLLKG